MHYCRPSVLEHIASCGGFWHRSSIAVRPAGPPLLITLGIQLFLSRLRRHERIHIRPELDNLPEQVRALLLPIVDRARVIRVSWRELFSYVSKPEPPFPLRVTAKGIREGGLDQKLTASITAFLNSLCFCSSSSTFCTYDFNCLN